MTDAARTVLPEPGVRPLVEEFAHRHSAVVDKLQWLDPNPHLQGLAAAVASLFQAAAGGVMEVVQDDGPQLTLGLQHLIDAKDCCVRAAVAASRR